MIIVILAVVVAAAARYIYKAKKSGAKCIGCAAGNSCCGCSCGSTEKPGADCHPAGGER